jgi:hypothetical protein
MDHTEFNVSCNTAALNENNKFSLGCTFITHSRTQVKKKSNKKVYKKKKKKIF